MGKIKFKSLSVKFILLLLVPSVLLMVVVGLICVQNVYRITGEMAEDAVYTANLADCEKIDTFFKKYRTILERSETDEDLKQYLSTMTSEVYETSKNKVYQQALRSLPYYLESMGEDSEYITMWVSDKDSDYMMEDSHSGKYYSRQDGWIMEQRPWYVQMEGHDGFTVTTPFEHYLDSSDVLISMVMPVYNYTKREMLGAVGADIRLKKLREMIDKNNLMSGKIIVLFDTEGKAFYSSDEDNTMTLSEYEEIRRKEYVEKNTEDSPVRSFTFQMNGEKMVACFANVEVTDWDILSIMPYSNIRDQVRMAALRVALILIVGVVILMGFLLSVFQGIIKPIKKMNGAMKKIADGNYEDRLEVESYDEIGQLSELVNNALKTLFYRSEYDSMTNLYSQVALYRKVDELLLKFPEEKFAAVILDIRQFKIINDVYGRSEGDRLLCYIAKMVGEKSSEDYLCARVGADMFYIFLKYEKQEDIVTLIKDFRNKAENNEYGIPLHLQFGINYVMENNENAVIVFDHAQLMLQKVKRSDGCDYLFYDDVIRKHMIEEAKLENLVESAILERQFVPFFQPKVSISTGKVVGAEALVRWNHPERGMISPGLFIPMCERTGKIMLVDEYMWEETCRILHEWILRGKDVVPISVNVSRIHVYDEQLVKKITSLIQKYEIPSKYLVLEVTESMYMDNLETLNALIKELSKAGFKISMDDFGSGYSSLNSLKDMTLDEIKIDQGFLNETVASDKGKIVISEMITMIKKLKMKIVAEGVETKEQAKYLKNVGCDVAQGFYYSRPIPKEQFEQIAFEQEFEKI